MSWIARRATRVLLALGLLPLLVVPGPPASPARAAYDPYLDALLLANGYAANILHAHGLSGLRASQGSYPTSIWTRDLDYAISGYAYVLDDLSVFRSSIELLLDAVSDDGVVAETIYLDRHVAENRESWDSMPNLIQAISTYVAKTGDNQFYQRSRDRLALVGNWITALDSDSDGLPDRDIFPYGYYDSVRNGVMHTYALARFYGAFRALAALEHATGHDGSSWEERADRLRAGFHRPVAQGGYWLDEQPWPIAWRTAGGRIVPLLETFGVFEALRSGLIVPRDGQRYSRLVGALHDLLPALIDWPTPMKLTLGGYPADLRRSVDPPVPLWMLDASAPWIVGVAVPVYLTAGYPQDAALLLRSFAAMAHASMPPVWEFAAGPGARYGPGRSADGGRAWDSAAWFLALYSGHYGLTMTPEMLIVHPYPIEARPGDGVANLGYQGASVQLQLDAARQTYRIAADRPIRVRLAPLGGMALLQLDGGVPQPSVDLVLRPGHSYTVFSLNAAPIGAVGRVPFSAR